MSGTLLHQREWIHDLSAVTDLEVEVWRARVPGIPGKSDDFARGDVLAGTDE
jgi:hypothetical protein